MRSRADAGAAKPTTGVATRTAPAASASLPFIFGPLQVLSDRSRRELRKGALADPVGDGRGQAPEGAHRHPGRRYQHERERDRRPEQPPLELPGS
jgi:hypothetical protein